MFLALSMAVLAFVLVGCDNSLLSLMKQNISECAKVYYFGENDKFYCTLSSGEREEAYFMDGQATGCVDYALLSVHFFENVQVRAVSAKICIDGEEKEIELEKNALNDNYMVDLECFLSGEEEVSITLFGQEQKLECLSNSFGVSFNDALEIASKEMAGQITRAKVGGNLNCEVYLRVLDKKANNMDEVFWCVTILNKNNENFSIVISTADGGVRAKSS